MAQVGRCTYLKAFAPSENEIAHGDANILIDDLTMPFRRIIVPKHAHGSNDLDTGGIRRHDDDALLVVGAFVARIALAHDKVQFRAWVSRTADPPSR